MKLKQMIEEKPIWLYGTEAYIKTEVIVAFRIDK